MCVSDVACILVKNSTSSANDNNTYFRTHSQSNQTAAETDSHFDLDYQCDVPHWRRPVNLMSRLIVIFIMSLLWSNNYFHHRVDAVIPQTSHSRTCGYNCMTYDLNCTGNLYFWNKRIHIYYLVVLHFWISNTLASSIKYFLPYNLETPQPGWHIDGATPPLAAALLSCVWRLAERHRLPAPAPRGVSAAAATSHGSVVQSTPQWVATFRF